MFGDFGTKSFEQNLILESGYLVSQIFSRLSELIKFFLQIDMSLVQPLVQEKRIHSGFARHYNTPLALIQMENQSLDLHVASIQNL